MSRSTRMRVEAAAAEFEGAKLGDERRSKRLLRMVDRLAMAPAQSFPKLVPDNGELEALYDFFACEQICWQDILAPHVVATVARCAAARVIRIAHDTTDFVFAGKREGLGPVMDRTQGFFCHTSLAVADDEVNSPLGVLALSPYVRTRHRGSKSMNEWKREARARKREDKESHRWERQAIEVNALLPKDVEAIHVMDQEADDFVAFERLQKAGCRFVIRISSARQVDGNRSEQLQDWLATVKGTTFRSIRVSSRSAAQAGRKGQKVHPVRAERVAELEVRWGEIRIVRPQHAQAETDELRLGVVQVFEAKPPEGEEPIAWTLLTTEQLLCAEDAAKVVDNYRARWVIEEFFKALKTGCSIEERQLTTYEGLVRALATLAPIAWNLLRLRSIARASDKALAKHFMHPEDLLVLGALLADRGSRPLPKPETVKDVLYAIANLGGHILNNGPPGWLVLSRGYDEFLRARRLQRLLVRAANHPRKCAES